MFRNLSIRPSAAGPGVHAGAHGSAHSSPSADNLIRSITMQEPRADAEAAAEVAERSVPKQGNEAYLATKEKVLETVHKARCGHGPDRAAGRARSFWSLPHSFSPRAA